jgi:hypothetical protein
MFLSSLWQVSVPRPWKVTQFEECVEISQPESTGALHISGARKQVRNVLDNETRAQLQKGCPDATEIQPVHFGDFVGYGTDHVDQNDGAYWKKWFVASGQVMLFITYNCKPGDEDLELSQVCNILSSLKLRQC